MYNVFIVSAIQQLTQTKKASNTVGIIVSRYERNRINSIDPTLKTLYNEVNEFFEFTKPEHPDLLAIHEAILDKTILGYGKFFHTTSMGDSNYFKEPSYDGWDDAGFRGVDFSTKNRDGTYDHSKWNKFKATETAQKLSEFYFETLEMFEFFDNQDYKYYFLNIADHNEDITLLREVGANEYVKWGDETLMSEEDWARAQEDFDNGYQHGLWNEVQGYSTRAVFNILEEIVDSMEWWDGDNGLRNEIESILSYDKTKVQSMLMVKELSDIMDSSISFNRKKERMERLVSKYEEICTDIEYD